MCLNSASSQSTRSFQSLHGKFYVWIVQKCNQTKVKPFEVATVIVFTFRVRVPKKVVESSKKEVLLQFGLPHHDVWLAVLKRVLHRRKRGNKFSLSFAGIFQRNYKISYDVGGVGSFTDISSSVSFSYIIVQRFWEERNLRDYSITVKVLEIVTV